MVECIVSKKGLNMNKKQIIITSLVLIIFVFTLSLGFALIFTRKPKQQDTQVYQKPNFVVRDYTYHKKTFPAPYKEVGALPKQ